jgi:hypothetical protein
VIIAIVGPVFSAISIWVSVIGIAFTIFSGIEKFIQLADWVRYLTIGWRNFTHQVWDAISPYIGLTLPIDLKDFATFVTMLTIALILGFFSSGRRLVVYDALVGVRMAIYGISHAINTSRLDGTRQKEIVRLQLLFFEVDTFLSNRLRTFLAYSVPFLIVFNLTIRIGVVYIPMIILVPESAFEDFLALRPLELNIYFFLHVFRTRLVSSSC